ncbi:MAG: hypothetical protein VKK59_02475 [Vampirovibrionales bacterium]|nr:hypothetical protein [Vampirovibrionales bacterium]
MSQDFFPYFCSQTDEPFCERIQIMNLALGYTEDQYALSVLMALHGFDAPEGLLSYLLPYIESRDCFKKPWQAVEVFKCPRRSNGLCCCQSLEQ